MINGIIGKKLGMTQVYGPSGKAEPVTVPPDDAPELADEPPAEHDLS